MHQTICRTANVASRITIFMHNGLKWILLKLLHFHNIFSNILHIIEALSNSRESGGAKGTCPSKLILTHCVSLALRQNTKSLPFSWFSLGKLLLRSKLSRLLTFFTVEKRDQKWQWVFVWSIRVLYLVFAWTFWGLWKLLYNFWFASGCIIDICSLVFSQLIFEFNFK